jgi:aspartate/methionine/tyrosine aminotransferase
LLAAAEPVIARAPELRTAISNLLAPVWPEVDPEDLVVVSGATAALDILASTLCDLGEAIVVPAPYYAAFDADLTGRSGARLVAAAMNASGFALDPVAADRALAAARRDGFVVRALAITSPSNPIGHVHPATVLRDLVNVATTHPYLPTVSAAAEHALWQRILRSAWVKILPGTAFACPEPGWFRLCHATDASTVATGINRLIRALEKS